MPASKAAGALDAGKGPARPDPDVGQYERGPCGPPAARKIPADARIAVLVFSRGRGTDGLGPRAAAALRHHPSFVATRTSAISARTRLLTAGSCLTSTTSTRRCPVP